MGTLSATISVTGVTEAQANAIVAALRNAAFPAGSYVTVEGTYGAQTS